MVSRVLPLVFLVVSSALLVSGQEETTDEGVSQRRSATFIPNVFPDEEADAPAPSDDENVIGTSPCPRGERGAICRQELAESTFSCESDSCMQCRRDCTSMDPSEWPLCCRDHFLCCRHLASACQQCDTPQLLPFCNAAFKRCN